jgi:3'-5' exoribonuclease
MSVPRPRTSISEWVDGQRLSAYVNLTQIRRRPYAGGVRWSAVAADATANISVNDFDGVIRDATEGFAAIAGEVSTYNGNLQLRPQRWRPIQPEDADHGFDPALLVPASKASPEKLGDILGAARSRLGDEAGKCWDAIMATYGEQLQTWPAAVKNHHAYRGGLLTHTCAMLAYAMAILDVHGDLKIYGDLDADALLLGVLMHDLGKIEELGGVPGNSRTLAGVSAGHVALGAILWDRIARGVNAPQKLREHVQHLILAHHGEHEYGSPARPVTAEAHVLHLIDMLDSRVAMVREATEADPDDLADVWPLGKALGRWPEGGR